MTMRVTKTFRRKGVHTTLPIGKVGGAKPMKIVQPPMPKLGMMMGSHPHMKGVLKG